MMKMPTTAAQPRALNSKAHAAVSPVEAMLAARLAQPITHNVVTRYADGTEKVHGVRSFGAAQNFAIGERRKIGRNLISYESGTTVRVVSVQVTPLTPV